jgi:hypothetical protein
MTAYYAGIGSRETPSDILAVMEKAAWHLNKEGWTLRSGHAPGADQAFENGARGKAQIFLPWRTFESEVRVCAAEVYNEPIRQAYAVAAEFHPAWEKLRRAAKTLHARNTHQMLGPKLDDVSSFVICWTRNGRASGGTAQALRIAESFQIQIFNLGDPFDLQLIEKWLNKTKGKK